MEGMLKYYTVIQSSASKSHKLMLKWLLVNFFIIVLILYLHHPADMHFEIK